MDATERMWRVVRKHLPPVTPGDVEQLAGVGEADALAFLEQLTAAGYTAKRAEGEFALVRDSGPQPPRVLAVRIVVDGNTGRIWPAAGCEEGLELLRQSLATQIRVELAAELAARPASRKAKPRGKGQVKREQQQRVNQRDVLWRNIRELREFSFEYLQTLTGFRPSTIRELLSLLVRDGYLAVEQPDRQQPAKYRLINDPGPERPATPERASKRAKTRRAA